MAKKKRDYNPDPKYRLGLWQKELLARVERIYVMKGAQACAWYNLHGLKQYTWNKETRRFVYNGKLMRREIDYYLSAVKLVDAGYLALYEYCGPNRDKMGFVPAWAPEATEAALRRKGSVKENIHIAGAIAYGKEKELKARMRQRNAKKVSK